MSNLRFPFPLSVPVDEKLVLKTFEPSDANKVAQSIEEVDLMIHTENCRTKEGTALCLGIWYEDEYVGKSFTRQGIAKKVLNVFINFLFNQLNMNRIEATTDIKNTASVRLLERLGFAREGTLRETYQLHSEWVDEAIFSMLRKDQH